MGERVSTDMVAIGCALSSEVSHDIAHTRRKIPGYRESTAVRARDSSLPSCTTRWIDQDYHDVAGRYLTHWAHWAHSSYRYCTKLNESDMTQHSIRRARGGGLCLRCQSGQPAATDIQYQLTMSVCISQQAGLLDTNKTNKPLLVGDGMI